MEITEITKIGKELEFIEEIIEDIYWDYELNKEKIDSLIDFIKKEGYFTVKN